MESRGNYQVRPLHTIGSGTFGRVEKIELYNTVGHFCGNYARKILCIDNNMVGSIFSQDDWRRRFDREVRYQSECVHDNVVPVLIHNLLVEEPWFVMPLADTDLATELSQGLLDNDDKLSIVKMMLEGVEFIHSKGYLHRDLKPENILKYSDGTYKVSDFGLVTHDDPNAASAVLTHIAVAMGSNGYMAPEVSSGLYDARTDIYAAGAVINNLNINNIPSIDAMITKATAYRPTQRYASVSEMISELKQIIRGRVA